MKTLPIKALQEVLRALVEVSVDTGVADDTSLVTRLDDSAKAWPVNAFTDLIVEITAGTGEGQVRKIASNTATSLVPVTNFATAPDATSQYRIGFYGKMTSDIASWGGTGLTGRNISADLQALTDPLITGILKSIGDIAAAESLIARIGAIADAVVDAGATGSMSAKLRRATTDLDSVKTEIGALADAAVAAGATGSLSAKLRRLTTDIDALNTAIGATDVALVDAGAVGAVSAKLRRLTTDLDALNTLIGATDAAVVDAGAVGAVSAKLRRLTTDIGALLTSLGATDDAVVDAGAAGSAAAKLRRLTTDLGALITRMGEVQDTPTANTVLDRLKDLLTGIILAAGTNVIGKTQDDFGGNVYSKTMTMTDDNATRFETSAKKLRDVVIIVKTHPMLLGETGVEVYPVAADESVGFTKVDISTLYFKNAGAGNNGVITILGTEE